MKTVHNSRKERKEEVGLASVGTSSDELVSKHGALPLSKITQFHLVGRVAVTRATSESCRHSCKIAGTTTDSSSGKQMPESWPWASESKEGGSKQSVVLGVGFFLCQRRTRKVRP